MTRVPAARAVHPEPLSAAQVRAFRLSRHHLVDRAPRVSLIPVVLDVCGIQAQVSSAANLSARARVEQVGKNLALLALLLKLVEATLWAVIALGHLAALVTLRGASEQARAIVGALLREQVTLNAVPGLVLGLGSVVFLCLLMRSKHVPRMLAGFGVLSYALVFVSNLLATTSPDHATVGSQMAWGAPSVLSELAIGSWLLIRGARVGQA